MIIVTGFGVSFLICVENRLTPPGVLGVDDRDAVGHDEHGGIPASTLAAQNEQVVLELFDLDDPRSLLPAAGLRLLIRGHRQESAPPTNTALNVAVRFMSAPFTA